VPSWTPVSAQGWRGLCLGVAESGRAVPSPPVSPLLLARLRGVSGIPMPPRSQRRPTCRSEADGPRRRHGARKPGKIS
jgi:hypothetical protein